MERKNVVTFKGKSITLIGEEMKVGQGAKDFKAVSTALKDVGLKDFDNKVKLIASVPSLDTPVCDTEIKRFNEEAKGLSKDTAIIFISMDLPFAQKRLCSSLDLDKVTTLSDHREASFGINYGVLIKELRLLSRAIFIIDRNNRVRYVEYVKELSSHPDYEAALNALKAL